MSGNNLGYTCPSCGSGDGILLRVTVDAHLTDIGLELGHDTDWDGDSDAECRECGWDGQECELVRAGKSGDAAA